MSPHQPTDELEIVEQSLQRVMWTEHKQLEQLLTEHRLTLPKFLVLISLIKREGGCPIGELADELFQSYPTMTGIVDRLAEDKLVAREREHAADRRKVVVNLTPQGKQLLQRARTARRERMRHALEKFSAHDRKEFVRLLLVYLQVLESDAA
jgi:DNA-binding MarR family transcriptional regulator